jgi:hypothetical protein
MGNENRRPDDVTHSSRHVDGEREGFTGGEDLSGREEFAGRRNVVRDRQEDAAAPDEPLPGDAGARPTGDG